MLNDIIKALPLASKTEVFHVGTLDLSERSEHTYEGHMGLSVSECPDEWQRIARLSGSVYQMTNDKGTFADFHNVDDVLWSKIFDWGITEGYITPHTYYAFDYEDCEWEMILRSTHETQEEALVEADGEHDVFPLPGYMGTDKFASLVGERQRNDAKLLLTILAVEADEIDGVLWEDTLDVSRLSAPRAIILNNRINRWNIQPM